MASESKLEPSVAKMRINGVTLDSNFISCLIRVSSKYSSKITLKTTLDGRLLLMENIIGWKMTLDQTTPKRILIQFYSYTIKQKAKKQATKN